MGYELFKLAFLDFLYLLLTYLLFYQLFHSVTVEQLACTVQNLSVVVAVIEIDMSTVAMLTWMKVYTYTRDDASFEKNIVQRF